MGSGSWDATTYATTTGTKIKSGTSFGYSSTMSYTARSARKAHELVDPKKISGPKSPFAGKNVRESRDIDGKVSTPIVAAFDTTGSMGYMPHTVQGKLGELFGLLLRKGYVEDPQIMISAYGDAYVDTVPLQVSEFEADNRIDEALDTLYLEGGGGGNRGETMSLLWYYLIHHTATDAWEKRGKKGYFFVVADEVALELKADHVRKFILPDDGEGNTIGEVAEDLSVEGLAKALQEQWEVFVYVVPTGSALMQGSLEFYKRLFGERAVELDNADALAETIALAIGMLEGTIDLDAGLDDLKEIGASDSVAKSAAKALATLDKTAAGGTLVETDLGSRVTFDDEDEPDVRL